MGLSEQQVTYCKFIGNSRMPSFFRFWKLNYRFLYLDLRLINSLLDYRMSWSPTSIFKYYVYQDKTKYSNVTEICIDSLVRQSNQPKGNNYIWDFVHFCLETPGPRLLTSHMRPIKSKKCFHVSKLISV